MFRRWTILIGVGLCLAITAGCQRFSAPVGLLEETSPHAHLSSQKLRTLVTDYVPRYAISVEEAADRILAETTDPAIRRNALLWKSQGISACFRAAARPDALASLMDIWALTRQSTEYFERTAGDPPLGAWQVAAIETSRKLEEPVRQIHATLGEGVPFGEKHVTEFVAKYPLTSLYFDRASIASEYIESIKMPTPDLMVVVSGVNENVADMRKLSALYADFLPKQARWQTELLLLDSVAQQPLAAALGNLTIAAQAADRAAATAESIPAVIEHQRQAAEQALTAERQAAFSELDRMRVDTLTTLREERLAVLAALREERELTAAAIEAAALRSLSSVDEKVAIRAGQLADRGDVLFEQIYRRTLQLVLIAAVVILGLVILRWWRPRTEERLARSAEVARPRPAELQRPERRPPRMVA